MIKTAVKETTREELGGVLALLVGDVRAYRDSEQKRLKDPATPLSEMWLTLGKVKALRDVLAVFDKIAELYKLEL